MNQKLTPEELKEFQELRNTVYETMSLLGDLTYRKILLDFDLENINKQIKENSIKEKEFMNKLGQKYGNGSINVETGEITPV